MALENWLNRNVETEQYRSRVRCVALGLGDLKACSEEMLSHALNLDDWPLLARHRFLDAWRVLKAEGAAPAPAVAAPAPAPAAPPPEVHWDGDGRYDYVAADAVRAVPWSAWGSLGRIFGK